MKKLSIFAIVLSSMFLFSCGQYTPAEYTTKEIIPEVSFFNAIITYPEFSKYKELSEEIKQDSLDTFEQVVEDTKDYWEEFNEGFKEFFGDEKDSVFGFDTSCLVSENKKYLSVLKTTYGFTGGAHGFTTLKSYTIDKKTKKSVDLPELVGMDYNQISEFCRECLKEKLLVDSNDDEKLFLIDNIESGTEPNADSFKIFTVNEDKVTVHFEQYSVAPYVFGEQQVVFPLAK